MAISHLSLERAYEDRRIKAPPSPDSLGAFTGKQARAFIATLIPKCIVSAYHQGTQKEWECKLPSA